MKNPMLFAVAIAIMCTTSLSAQDSITLSKKNTVARIQYGTASYYHNKFQDRKTATGEKFDQKKYTAAHNGLPLNTWIKVTNLRNKKSVIVRVNDRLHYKNKRLVDLSREAASKLGYISRGLTKVKVEVLGSKKPPQYDESKWNK